MKITILIPTYNEKENIIILLNELVARTKKLPKHKFQILIVDDNSPDGTGKLVTEFARTHINIILLSGKKEGLGKAMVRGYKYVLANLKPDVVITNEADFGFSFKHLPLMIRKIEEGYDVVVASRHTGNGRTDGWSFDRRANHLIANSFFAGTIAGITEVHDKNGAFRAIRVKGILDKINFSKLPSVGFGFFFYMIYELSKVTDKFYEFATVFKFRTRGESKVTFNPKYLRVYLHDIMEYIKLAFKIRMERLSSKS